MCVDKKQIKMILVNYSQLSDTRTRPKTHQTQYIYRIITTFIRKYLLHTYSMRDYARKMLCLNAE